MEKLPIIEMAEINNHIINSDNYQNVVTVADVDASWSVTDPSHMGYSAPVRLNALFVVLVRQGEVKVSLDYIPYTLTANSFLIIMPSHVFQVAESSTDMMGTILIIDITFLEECAPEKRSPSMAGYMQLRSNPCTSLLPAETASISEGIQTLRRKISLRTHSFHKEVMQVAFIGFLLDVADILIGKKETLKRSTLSRKEEIMNQFLELLFTHVKTHHVVTFYADKLFITPQYLSLILKELTGKSANKWIDEALMVEAKVLLKMPQVTVQQVADQLNFSDQSTFGKFFKKHQGVSPLEYRRS